MQLLIFHCDFGFLFYLITDDWFVSVHGYRSWSEGLPGSCWTEALCRLYQIFSCTSCDPARKGTRVFHSGFLHGRLWDLQIKPFLMFTRHGCISYAAMRKKKVAYLWHSFSLCSLLMKVWVERGLVHNAVVVVPSNKQLDLFKWCLKTWTARPSCFSPPQVINGWKSSWFYYGRLLSLPPGLKIEFRGSSELKVLLISEGFGCLLHAWTGLFSFS